jgi:hypothetical protein
MYDLAAMQKPRPAVPRYTYGEARTLEVLPSRGIQSTPALTRGRQLSPERSTNAIAPAFIAAIGQDKGAYT